MPERMRAYRMITKGGEAQWQDVDVPVAAAGDVVIETAGAGLCRTDLEMMDHGARYYRWSGPYTLGHETAGRVVEIGAGVEGFAIGDAVLVCANASCGHCEMCRSGRDQFCTVRPPNYGYGADGGLAPYLAARQRDIVPLRGLDPAVLAPLADAGATAYGALLRCRPFLADDGFVAVIGVGGVGSLAVQLLRALTGVRVIAIDHAHRLAIAESAGAHVTVAAGGDAAERIRVATRGRGVDATIDIVGTDETLQLSTAITRVLGAIAVVGLSGGSYHWSMAAQAMGVQVFSSTTCSLGDLARLVTVAERGLIDIEHQAFNFADVETAYDALRRGQVAGRPIVTFGR